MCSLVTTATANSFKREKGHFAFILILRQLGMSHYKDKENKTNVTVGGSGRTAFNNFLYSFCNVSVNPKLFKIKRFNNKKKKTLNTGRCVTGKY